MSLEISSRPRARGLRRLVRGAFVGAALGLAATVASAANWFVSIDSGIDNTNTGTTSTSAFKTIGRALTAAQGGDTIRVLGSATQTYPAINITKGGSLASGRITIQADNPANRPVIVFSGYYGIAINTSYLTIDGFRVRGVANNSSASIQAAQNYATAYKAGTVAYDPYYDGKGILVQGSATNIRHDITIRNCEVWLAPGSGIVATGADYLTIEKNNVHENCYWTPNGESGINVYNLRSWGTATGAKVYVRQNRSWGNRLYVPWINAPGGPKITDGNGIIADVNNATAYNGIIRIENNLCYLNGGRGLNVTRSDRTELVNNTTYANAVSTEVTSELYVGYSANVKVYNNIFWTRSGKDARLLSSASGVDMNTNIYYQSAPSWYGTGERYEFPGLVNGPALDFKLLSNSPAINDANTALTTTVDFDGKARSTPDIGAYEY